MEAEYEYDLFVIGGGSGGIKAATTAAKLGAKVAVADYVVPSPFGTTWGLGGTCVNVGCIPKKLFHYASLLGEAKEDSNAVGWDVEPHGTHDWKKMTDSVQKYIRNLRWNAKLVLGEMKIKYYNMLAKFVDDHTVEVYDPKKEKRETVTAKNILIAVGGRPTTLAHIPNFKELTISSDDVFYLKQNPGKTLVVGASYIALECAGFLKGLGNDVTVMVRSVLLRSFDQSAATRVGKFMESKGTKFIYGAVPEAIEKLEDGRKKVSFRDQNGNIQSDVYDSILVAIGRVANTPYLNLEAAGVKIDAENNKVFTNEFEQTSTPNIYCVGDCAFGKPELTPPAVMAGKLLSERLFNGSKKLMNYKMIATTVFTPLEYSIIGYGEDEAINIFGRNNITAYHTVFKPLEWIYIENRPNDLCYVKMICKKDENEKVIGLHYVGPNAGEVVQGFSVAVNLGATREDFANTVGIHPTCAEEVLELNVPSDQSPEAAGGCKGCGI
jgi:thioredoxin reductase (NADPH)